MRVGRNGGCGGSDRVQGEAHPLQKRDACFAITVSLDEGRSGAFVAGRMKDDLRREPELDGGGMRPGLCGDFLSHVGAGIRSCGGPLRGQHCGKMAGLVKEIARVEQTLGVHDEAARFQRDAGQETVGGDWRQANGETDLPELIEDQSCREIKHRH